MDRSRRACVVFNPAAQGDKARRFREQLLDIAPRAELRPTTGPGSARALAREAAEAGYDVVIAAGGDGTVFEVLNGLADVHGGLERVILGVLPLGTANVFARELNLPRAPDAAWQALETASVRRIDCGLASYQDDSGQPRTARFLAVAGAGLDARAVQLVDWSLKKRMGRFAYIVAALRALLAYQDRPCCELAGRPFTGRAVLAGNGSRYAGDLRVFGDGALDSGRLHVRGVARIGPGLLLRCLAAYLTGRWILEGRLATDTVSELLLTAANPVPLELDGEFAGWLPATLRILPGALRVLAPG